jgi:hypothetical protein
MSYLHTNTGTGCSKRALAHLFLEGITLSSALLTDMELLDAGKISKDEFIERGLHEAGLTDIKTLPKISIDRNV